MRLFRKIPDWLIYLALLVIIIGNVMGKSRPDHVPIAPPELGEALPNMRPTDPALIVEIDAPHAGMGTAFAVDNDGTWITARHVVDSCDKVLLKLGGLKYVEVDKVDISQNTDVAVLTSHWKREPLARDVNNRRQTGERGYFMGFPQGKPGEVAGKLIGRHRMLIRGRYRSAEPVLAWAEIGRSRGLTGSIGGLSGGPVFDKDGEIIGLVSAESSPRRGRVYTVAPRSLAKSLPPLMQLPDADPVALDTYGQIADKYRRERRIAKVICMLD